MTYCSMKSHSFSNIIFTPSIFMNFSPAVQHGLIQTAKDAAALLMQYYKTDLVIDKKEDKSPVTAADHAANSLIMAALQRLTPHIPVIAEESAETHAMDVSGAEAFWLEIGRAHV